MAARRVQKRVPRPFYTLFSLLLLVTAHAAECCTIPVFRYALDRWEADKFRLVLPENAAQDTQLADLLRPLRANGKGNLAITTTAETGQTRPVLFDSRSGKSLWEGALDEASLAGILDSPAREQLVARLLAGDSVVWVIAEDGSPKAAAQAERIEQRLKFLEQVAALPLQDPNDPDSQLGPGPPLLLKFTSLRLRQDAPAERLLLRMLCGGGAEFDPEKTSFAAAVFGRGRVLGAWPLEMLDERQIEEACMFLVGRCSCRVKDQNPGWDLLLNVDWDQRLRNIATSKTAAAPPAEQNPQNEPWQALAAEEIVIEPESDSTAVAGKQSTLPWVGLASLTLIVTLLWLKRRH